MTAKEFSAQGYAIHLRAFLETPAGKALLEVLEERGKPSSKARNQHGTAEDVKLQMSLNYVAMSEVFATVEAIRDLASAAPIRVPQAHHTDLIPEDASAEELKARGIVIPALPDLRKSAETAAQPVTSTTSS